MKHYGAVTFFLVSTAFGQTVSSATTAREFQGSATFSGPAFPEPVVAGAPYSGEQVFEHIQTLADGTHIKQNTPASQKTWRDSQGRTRTEQPMGPRNPSSDTPAIVRINDPVAGYQYILDTVNRVAHRMAVSPANRGQLAVMAARRATATEVSGEGGGGGAAELVRSGVIAAAIPAPLSNTTQQPGAQPRDVPRPQSTSETLGTKFIDGVLVEGTRHTVVYPTGFQGNDAPITVLSEQWYSPELKLMMLSTTDDPRSGVSTHKIANFSRSEPDPSLFMVPADYAVVEEAGAFTIRWGDK